MKPEEVNKHAVTAAEKLMRASRSGTGCKLNAAEADLIFVALSNAMKDKMLPAAVATVLEGVDVLAKVVQSKNGLLQVTDRTGKLNLTFSRGEAGPLMSQIGNRTVSFWKARVGMHGIALLDMLEEQGW